MRGIRELVAVLALAVIAAGCGSSSGRQSPTTHTDPGGRIVRLKPGRYTFRLGGRVKVGDKILCVTANGSAAGGGLVPKANGGGVGSSTGFGLVVSSGSVKITCPANPGIM